jgi:hypothetical protein
MLLLDGRCGIVAGVRPAIAMMLGIDEPSVNKVNQLT